MNRKAPKSAAAGMAVGGQQGEAHREPDSHERDLSHLSIDDLVAMAACCMGSEDQSDKEFAKACRDEIARRKPGPKASE